MKGVKFLDYLIEKIEEDKGIDLKSKGKSRESVYLRAVFFEIAITTTAMSQVYIASLVGRSHSSLIHSRDNVFEHVKRFRPDLMVYKESLMSCLDITSFYKMKYEQTLDSLLSYKSEFNKILDLRYKDFVSSQDFREAIDEATRKLPLK